MYIYTLRDGEKMILLQHENQFTQKEFDALVFKFRYEYPGEMYQNEYSITEVANDLEDEGFIIVPSVIF